MDNNGIKRVSVIGAGLMGSQIAEILLRVGGYYVDMMDVSDSALKMGLESIDQRIERFFVLKGKLTGDQKNGILSNLGTHTDIKESVKEADFVIEAASENLSIKRELFRELDLMSPKHTILASNTSFQNISEMASVTSRADKVVGTHFFNPVAIMNLVEVVRGTLTSDETTRIACDLAEKLGKEPVICRDSSYGFLANRAYGAMMDEAVSMVWERVASPHDIDRALKLGYNLPMGPLELRDFTGSVGIDIASEEDKIRELGPEKGKLHPLTRMMYRAGYTKIYDFWNDILCKW